MNNLNKWAGRGALATIAVTIAFTTIIGLVVVYCVAIAVAWIVVEIERLGDAVT
jgi:hypothetical protein